jgi:hypothetical protein
MATPPDATRNRADADKVVANAVPPKETVSPDATARDGCMGTARSRVAAGLAIE